MLENQTVKERLIAYIRYLGIGQGKFEASCGLANGYVNNIRKSITPEKLQIIARQYPDLNTGWLITGEGDMLRASVVQNGDNNNNQQSNGNSYNSSSALDKAFDEIAEMRKLLAESIRNNKEQADNFFAIIKEMSK